jgi:molecular chaperone DnaJ
MAALKPGDDPYRILGVLPGADLGQIKAAHRRLAKRFHPDRAIGDEERFLAVQEAYQLLSDPNRRSEWDRLHAHGPVRATTAARPRA